MPFLATERMILLLGGWAIVVSGAFDVWENNSARFDIGPRLLIGALTFAVRLADRRLGRRRPIVGDTIAAA